MTRVCRRVTRAATRTGRPAAHRTRNPRARTPAIDPLPTVTATVTAMVRLQLLMELEDIEALADAAELAAQDTRDPARVRSLRRSAARLRYSHAKALDRVQGDTPAGPGGNPSPQEGSPHAG